MQIEQSAIIRKTKEKQGKATNGEGRSFCAGATEVTPGDTKMRHGNPRGTKQGSYGTTFTGLFLISSRF